VGMGHLWAALDDAARAEHAPGLHASVARLLLGACALTGDPRAGLLAADRALGPGTSVRTWESEARRLRGEFLAAVGAPGDQVEAELRQALGIARGQGARMLELRAATSLLGHHLGGDRRRASRSRATLASIVHELPAAAQTPELRAATTVLSRG